MSNYIKDHLQPQHAAMLLEESGISEDVIEERGYRTIEDHKELLKLGFSKSQVSARRVPGLLLPIWETDGRNGIAVYRPDNPRVREDKRKKNTDGTYKNHVIKYEMPAGTTMRLDIHPRVQQWVGNPNKRLWIVEGQKKADALVSRGEVAIALLGVNSWRGTNEHDGLTSLPDWNEVAFNDRTVYIVFDSDGWSNVNIQKAAGALRKWINWKKGVVHVRFMSPNADDSKRGVDDYFAAGGTVDGILEALEAPTSGTKRKDKPTSEEFVNVLESLGYTFRFNEVSDKVEVNTLQIDDTIEAVMASQMYDLGYGNFSIVRNAYTRRAYASKYHPVKDYLERLKWDGRNHIAKLAGFFEDEHERFEDYTAFHVLLYRWLIGAVAKVYNQHQNPVLVLDGRQELGKSKFAAWLGSPIENHFVERSINPDDKDSQTLLIEKWIWEISELGATTRRADREALKHFITMGHVTVRRPYARYDVTRPAMASLVGTINNESGFLTDPTGSRRFLCCTLSEIDWQGYTKNVDVNQVWAQAYAAFEKDALSCELTPVEKELQRTLNAEYEVDDPILDYLQRYYNIDTDNESERTLVADIITTLQMHGVRGTDRTISMRLASVAKRLRLERYRTNSGRGYKGIWPKNDDGETLEF